MADKLAIITGAGGGMGRSIAHKLAEQGIHPVLIGRTESKLQTVADEIASKGGSATIYPLDVTDSEGLVKLAESYADQKVDVLVNCAGDYLIEPIDNTDNARLDHILDLNLRAPYVLTRSFLPNLRMSDNASIINIGSFAAVYTFGGISAYSAAKHGLRGLTGSLADELKSEKIRVVMVSPSPANTPMRWDATPDADPATLVEPETIADAVWFVVSLPKGITTSDFTIHSMSVSL